VFTRHSVAARHLAYAARRGAETVNSFAVKYTGTGAR